MTETVFTYGAPALKFGPGASAEIGYDLLQAGARRVLLVTDPGWPPPGTPPGSPTRWPAAGLDVTTYDGVHVEPTDDSMSDAIDFAREHGPFDAVVAVGGGSAIDTAKAVNLLLTNPGELMDYVNAPVGKATAPVNPLLPLVAVPTTTGTGSESTTICVLDVLSLKVKTGISHPRLRPTLAVVDPTLTATQPAMVTAAAGMDILCHALESYTARWYAGFDAKQPEQRVPYCGANPIADMWSEKAMSLLAGAFRTASKTAPTPTPGSRWRWRPPSPASASATPGVHIPHANAYPIAGRVRDYRPPGYPEDEPIVPHGMAVSLTAPGGLPVHVRGRAGAAPARGAAARPAPPRRRAGRAAGVLLPADARRRAPQRPRRGGVRRRRRRRPRRRLAQAAAAARHRPARGHRRRPGGRVPRVDGALVTGTGPTADLVAELRRRGLTDVDDSVLARALYSSDASLYRVVPQVVVRPRHPDEMLAALDVARPRACR